MNIKNINLRLNQDHSLLSYCSDSGCRIYNVDPINVKLNLEVQDFGTLSICEMLHRTNLLALVAGGARPKFADNTVVIWDDEIKQFVLELTFSSPVLAVRIQTTKIVVAEASQIHCFSTQTNVRKLFTVNTRHNPKGLFEISHSTSERQLLGIPGHRVGSIQMINMAKCEPGASSSPTYVNAHESEIACMAMNHHSTLLATASEKGTLIRVFDTTSVYRVFQIVELRRGSDVATFYCLNFSQNSEFLCASSDKGTVHIFALKDVHLNKRSSLKKISFLGSYVESQWAFASFTVAAERACVCAFGADDSVFVILTLNDIINQAACVDGTFTRYTYTLDGQCNRLSYDVFSEMTTVNEDE